MKNFVGKVISIAVIYTLSPSISLASLITKITMDCPQISEYTKDKVINYGTYIAGAGTERANGKPAIHPLFQGPTVPGADIPIDLKAAGYDGYKVTYNPANGAVTCYFKSCQGHDPFTISYLMVNALNGTTVSSGHGQIHINLPVGLIK